MIEIRNSFRAEELPRLYEIECLCFPEVFRWDKEDFGPCLRQSDVWIADYVEDGCQCGQVWNCICKDTPKETQEIAGFLVSSVKYGKGYIMSIDTEPEHQRKGIGAKLMCAAEEHYQKLGLRRMYLEVAVGNPAQTLYFKLGYRVTRVRPNYYDDGSSCLVMTKELDSVNDAVNATVVSATPLATVI